MPAAITAFTAKTFFYFRRFAQSIHVAGNVGVVQIPAEEREVPGSERLCRRIFAEAGHEK